MTETAKPAKKSSKPTIRERVRDRVCPNCGKPSPERRSNRGPAPLYCGPECKRAMGNRNITDGAALLPYLKAWRIDRGSGEIAQESFARICKMLDELNEQDKLANRPRADYHAATLLNSNAAPVNELRYGWRKMEETRKREAQASTPTAQAAPDFNWE